MKLVRLIVLCLSSFALMFAQNSQTVTVKAMEPSAQYPTLARYARLQGTVSVHLKISADGQVIGAEAITTDQVLKDHPLLQSETVKLVKRWTFQCDGCKPDSEYEHILVFTYRILGKPDSQVHTKITIDSPDHLTITSNPPEQNFEPATVSQR